MSIENRLTDEQIAQAAAFLDKLKPADRENVERVTELLSKFAESYDRMYPIEFGDQNAIFGAYGIGGWVNKQGERPDLDLLVVTGVKWDQAGYIHIESEGPRDFWGDAKGDQLVVALASHFTNNGFGVDLPKDIPNEYSEGAEPRVLIRLTPQEGSEASPIDMVYVAGGYSDPRMNSFKEFYEFDVNDNGSPMGRVALLETVVLKEPIRMRP